MLFQCQPVTAPGSFTAGIEGPACDRDGNLYAVNYAREGTIGRVTPAGECEVFVTLPEGSVGNGIRANHAGDTLFVADYTGHNVLAIDLQTRAVRTFAHEPAANQPNDLAIDHDDTLYASDPNWQRSIGQIWRVERGRFVLLETNMGTTNGIEIDMQRRTLFVNESVQRRIWAYDLLPDGALSGKRLFHQFDDHLLDGMRCDVAGNLYVTRHGRGTVACLSPQGELVREIEMGGRYTTNLAFGGVDGCTCYVTIADLGAVESFRVDLPGQSWWRWQAP
jgi:sugar lactone lactonase YvrE